VPVKTCVLVQFLSITFAHNCTSINGYTGVICSRCLQAVTFFDCFK